MPTVGGKRRPDADPGIDRIGPFTFVQPNPAWRQSGIPEENTTRCREGAAEWTPRQGSEGRRVEWITMADGAGTR